MPHTHTSHKQSLSPSSLACWFKHHPHSHIITTISHSNRNTSSQLKYSPGTRFFQFFVCTESRIKSKRIPRIKFRVCKLFLQFDHPHNSSSAFISINKFIHCTSSLANGGSRDLFSPRPDLCCVAIQFRRFHAPPSLLPSHCLRILWLLLIQIIM